MSRLAQPLQMRGLTMPTRIVMPAMASALATENGLVSPELLEHYRRPAHAGGMGAIVVEHAFVHPQGRLAPKQLSIADDDVIEGLAQLAATIHGEGTDVLAICQLAHAGSEALPANLDAGLVGPSPQVHPGRKRSGNTGLVPHELSTSEIAELVETFAQAAARAMAAGFDGVEVHAAHGYLLDQFYSPLTNQRLDAYGRTSVENRIRLTCEVTTAVRMAVGEKCLVWVRVGPCDYAPGGATIEEGIQAARLVEAAGADVIDVSGGIYNFSTHALRPPGFFRDSSTLIREATGAPVLTCGGVHWPAEAEWLLETGACDLVGMGRAIWRQPGWAARAIAELEKAD